MIDLTAAGLSKNEAICYKMLLTKRTWQPAELAKSVQITRTNCYKILDKLVSYGLAEKLDTSKKQSYRALNPAKLIEMLHENKLKQEKLEKELEINVHELQRDYLKVHEQPAIRYFQGKSDLKNIFLDQVNTKSPIFFIHTLAGIDFYGYSHMHNLRMLAVNNGIRRFALTPDTDNATVDYKETDKLFLLRRTWLKSDDYTAPVEWGAYGDKLYIISYGKEALGMIIESPQIAEAFRQLFALLERGQKSQSWYKELPSLAKRKAKVN